MSLGENCTFPAGRPGTLSRSNWPADPATGHSLGSSIDLGRICVPHSQRTELKFASHGVHGLAESATAIATTKVNAAGVRTHFLMTTSLISGLGVGPLSRLVAPGPPRGRLRSRHLDHPIARYVLAEARLPNWPPGLSSTFECDRIDDPSQVRAVLHG